MKTFVIGDIHGAHHALLRYLKLSQFDKRQDCLICLMEGITLEEWWDQEGAESAISYKGAGMPQEHIQFLSAATPYFIDNNRLFVHGGFDPERPIEETPKEIFIWDRKLIRTAREMHLISGEHKFGNYDEIYIGHTPTINFGQTEPQKFCNVWAMDTGAGWGAKLTIMDIATKQWWQSESV